MKKSALILSIISGILAIGALLLVWFLPSYVTPSDVTYAIGGIAAIAPKVFGAFLSIFSFGPNPSDPFNPYFNIAFVICLAILAALWLIHLIFLIVKKRPSSVPTDVMWLLFGFAGIMSITLAPLEKSLTAPLSARLAAVLPAYFDWTNLDHFRQYSGVSLLLMSTAYLILNGFVGPIVEELFFRGYLTSKLSRYGKGAPVIITVLFSLYHFWLPFQNLFRISVFLPAAYFTWKEKNLYIGMVFHCISNIFTVISFLIALYAV